MNEEPGAPPPPDLTDHVVLVTGAAHGIGQATALALAQAGARLVAIDREPLDELTAQLRQAGAAEPLALTVDLADEQALQRTLDEVTRRLGRLDVVVNNAGICPAQPLLALDRSSWRAVFDVNLDATVQICVHALKLMRDQPLSPLLGCRGKIVNVSSAAARVGRPLLPAYGASKAALDHLTSSIAVAHAEDAICATVVYPGSVADGMWSRLGRELAAAENAPVEEVVRTRLAQTPTGRFQAAAETAAFIRWAIGRPGLELTGKVLWTEPHATPL